MAVRIVSSGPRGRKTYEIRWKDGELYDYTDNLYDAKRKAAQARKEERERSNPRRKNLSKAERAVASQKASAKRRIAVALAKYLKQQNPGVKLAGAQIEHLKHGVLKITPIKANAAGTPTLTKVIAKLQKRHRGTRRQRSYHGAGRYSVQFFSRATGALVADYDLKQAPNGEWDWFGPNR